MNTDGAPKPWQHGYGIDDLLTIEALYADYNRHSVSPFSAVKKHVIAELLHARRLRVTDASSFSVTTAKVSTPIHVYHDVEVGRKQVGDLTLAHFAGDHHEIAQRLDSYRDSHAWAMSWADARETNDTLTRAGFRRVGSKVTTFGEIYFVYFRDAMGGADDLFGASTRELPSLPREELVGIKRIGHIGSASLLPLLNTLTDLALTFTNHYSNYNKDESWSAISLRGFSADPAFIAKPIEMSKKWKAEHEREMFALQDTPLRAQFPTLDPLLAPYSDAFERIRFMQLKPGGGELERHTDQVDPQTGVRLGNNARLHIPIVTNDRVEFTSWDLDNVPHVVTMRAGEVWYLDTRKPHRALNAGETHRVHLVVDVIVTPRFVELLNVV